MFKPEMDNLFFMGLFQPLGAIFPATERQACLAGEYLCGRYSLPTADAMHKEIETDRQAMFHRYVKSKRHTMQVDFDAFMAHPPRDACRRTARRGRWPPAARRRAGPHSGGHGDRCGTRPSHRTRYEAADRRWQIAPLLRRAHCTSLPTAKWRATRDCVRRCGLVRERGHQVHISVTWEAGDAERFVRDAAAAGAEGVVAAGGDGTINEVVSGLAALTQSAAEQPHLPALGIVPMGTANDFARGCCVPTDDLTEALLNAAEGVAVPIDVGRVNGHTFANVATGGFGTQVTVDTPPEVKRLLGRVAYLVSGVASIGRLQARSIGVAPPDFQCEGATYVFAVGNGRQAGGGFQMCEHALVNDGFLDLMIVPDVPYDQALALLRELLSPPPHTNYQSVIYRQVPWVEISSTAGLSMNLDGEPLTADTFRFEVAPRAISCFLPAGAPLAQ